jgi:hypothetical protein
VSSKIAVLVGHWRRSRVFRASREGNIKMSICSMYSINQKRWRQKEMQWEMQEAEEAMGKECSDEIEDVLDG